MIKKTLILTILFILISIFFSPIISSYDNSIGYINNNKKSMFTVSPLIDVIYEPLNESVIPLSGVYTIPLGVIVRLTGKYADLQLRLLKNGKIPVELSIINADSWCDVQIENPYLSITPESDNPEIAILKVSVNENAPAFTQSRVRIKATSSSIQGFFFERITEGEKEFDVSFVNGYLPVVNYEIEKKSYEIPVNSETKVPIKIKNLGNGYTNINIEIIEKPNTFNISIPSSVKLGAPKNGGKAETEVNLIVRPRKSFNNENIRLKFTPNYVGRPDLKGLPEIINVFFKDDGSYGENIDFFSKNASPIILITLVLGIVLFLVYRKKYKE